METENNDMDYSISSLKEEIDANEQLIDGYLKTAENMKWMAIGAVSLSLFFFIIGSVASGFIGTFLGFLCVRKYNKSIGMAEVYFGVTKYLKFVLQREITGDTSIPSFLQ